MVKLIIIDPKNQNKYKNKFLNHYNNGDLTAHMVYMPGCGHCDDMKPSWKSACQKYNNPDYKMITIIHMQSYSDFMGSKDSPMGFPHVVAHQNQKITPYSGDRTEEDISKWLDKQSKTKKIVFRGGKKSLKYRTFNKITKKNKGGNGKRKLNGTDKEFLEKRNEKRQRSIDMARLFGYRNSPERDPRYMTPAFLYTDPHGIKERQKRFNSEMNEEEDYMEAEKAGLTIGGKKTRRYKKKHRTTIKKK